MNIFAINGSPRKTGNTATVLRSALDGVREVATADDTAGEFIHVYDLNFSSCISCFACKKIGSKSYGKCALHDELTPLLKKLEQADGIIFGSPVYFGDITGKMRSFMERLLFPYCTYDTDYATIAPKKMKTAFVYTMNVTQETMNIIGYPDKFAVLEAFVGKVFSPPALLHVNNTYQFDDYTKYIVKTFSETDKRLHREQQFPLDCQHAHAIGRDMALAALSAAKV